MDKRFDIVGIGSMVVDLIYRTPRIIGSEEKIALDRHETGEAVRKMVGGVTLNHLSWAALLGLKAGIFGRQGDDDNGRFLRAGMERYGIDRNITLDGSASSFAHLFVDPNGNRAIYMCPGATSETTGEYIRTHHADYIRSARLLSTEVSQLPLDAVLAVLEIAVESKIPTILDVDIPPSDAVRSLGSADDFERALKFASYIKPSKGAASEITGESDALAAAVSLREKYGARAVIITDGAGGCALASEDQTLEVPSYPISSLDSTGAGDAFLGGLIAGLHYEMEWPDILKLANACGAACCEITGATPDTETSLRRVLELYDGKPLGISVSAPGTTPESPYDDAVAAFLAIAPEELASLGERIGDQTDIQRIADLIMKAEAGGGRVHVTGVGKPEYVAGYISALLSSTGTPAYFLHGTECVHGSAGQVVNGDVVIVISNSGETAEMKGTVAALKKLGALIVGVSGKSESWLARQSDLFLFAGVTREGSPLNFEPRASILAEIYVLAALSIELQSRKCITRAQYNSWHPGGTIGLATKE